MGYYDGVELITFPFQQENDMAAYPALRRSLADILRHNHDKMVAETLELFGLPEGDFTAEELRSLQAFDSDPMVNILVAAIERRQHEKRAKAST
jgi:hypothetical protein